MSVTWARAEAMTTVAVPSTVPVSGVVNVSSSALAVEIV